MTDTADRIDELLETSTETPYGPEERLLLEEALTLAVESADEEREYRVRMQLSASAVMTGDTDTLLSCFAWCVGKHDSDPVRFPQKSGEDNDLLWHYKWMASSLSASPIFSVEQIRATLGDMRARYNRAGVGLSGVLTAEFETAAMNGWAEEAERAYQALLVSERDDYSHCDACVRSLSAKYLADTAREPGALALYDELFEGGFVCADEPEGAQSDALLPLLRAGRFEEAKRAHLSSYRRARSNPDNLGMIANHLVFCAVTGNEARGLMLLERHLLWLVHDGLELRKRFRALLALGVLLDAVTAAGHGATPVRGADAPDLEEVFGPHDGQWSVAELSAASWSAARGIAAAFDARNGNAHFAEQVARTEREAGERYDLPLQSDAVALAPPVDPVTPPEPETAEQWCDRALELRICDRHAEAIAAARRGLETAETAERPRLLQQIVRAEFERGDRTAADAALAERVAALVAAGAAESAASEQRVGLLVHGFEPEPEEAVPLLETELALLADADAPAEAVARVALALASALVKTERTDDTLATASLAVDRATAAGLPILLAGALQLFAVVSARQGDTDGALGALDTLLARELPPISRARAFVQRAMLFGSTQCFEEGLAAADEAFRIDLAGGYRAQIIDDAVLAAQLLDDLGRGVEAAGRLRVAIQHAELAESPRTVGLRFLLGRQLVSSGLPDDGIDVLNGVLDAETEQGAAPGARAETVSWLARGFADVEEYSEAIDAYRASVSLYEEAEDWAGATTASCDLGAFFLSGGLPELAADTLERAVELARRDPENLSALARALHLLGRAQCESGEEAGLDTLSEVDALAREHEADWLVADVTDSRARGLSSLGRPEEAVSTALVAADLFVAAGDPHSAGFATLFAARLLAEAQRDEEAIALYRSCADDAEEGSDLQAVASLELADLLERAGRASEAVELRTRFSDGG